MDKEDEIEQNVEEGEQEQQAQEDVAVVGEDEHAAEKTGDGSAGSEDEDWQPPKPISDKPLTFDILAPGLSLLGRTGNGLSHAYIRLQLNGRGLSSIDILDGYPHIRFLDLSDNFLKTVDELANLEYLLFLDLHTNYIQEISSKLDKRKFLQQVNLANNQLHKFHITRWPLCRWLNLSHNKLSELKFADFGELQYLNISNNKFKTIPQFNSLSNLQELLMDNNKLTAISGLADKKKLTTLLLRNNRIESLTAISQIPCLENLDLIGNRVSSFAEVEKLANIKTLNKLSLLENPVADIEMYRLEVVSRIHQLSKLDEDDVLEDEKEEAQLFRIEKNEQAAGKGRDKLKESGEEEA